MKSRLSPGNTETSPWQMCPHTGQGWLWARPSLLLKEEEQEEWPLMSAPDWLTEHSVYTWKVATDWPVGIPTIFGRSVDLFFKEEELAFPVFDFH